MAVDRITAGAFAIPGQYMASTYHLIILDPVARNLRMAAFSRDNLREADHQYAEVEKRIQGGEKLQAVLVSAGSLADLRRAYPIYFFNKREFLSVLNRLKGEHGV